MGKKTNLVGVIDPSEFKPVDIEISRKYKKLDFILKNIRALNALL